MHAKQHQTQNHLEAAAWNAQQHRESWPTLVKTKKQGLKQNKFTLAVLHRPHKLTAQPKWVEMKNIEMFVDKHGTLRMPN